MAGERYRHIFLPGPTRSQGFTNPKSGGSSPRIPARNRIEHSEYLKRRLDETWAASDDRHAVVHTDRLGAYIEFVGEPGFALAIKSLEDIRSGIRLQNVRREGEEKAEQTFATVYVPHDKRPHFLRKIHAYATEIDKRSNNPKNATLINSISDIHLAVLESFWHPDERPLIPGATPQWIEVWLSTDREDAIARFEASRETLQMESKEGILIFPERSVKLILANRDQLAQLIEVSDDIAEFRLAKEVATFYIEQENRDQSRLVRALLDRTNYNNDSGVAVCILDTGVNNGHPLLRPVLADDDLHTVRAEWGSHDHGGHGTLMAGTAAYGDILDILNATGPVSVVHRLESAKISPSTAGRKSQEALGVDHGPRGQPCRDSGAGSQAHRMPRDHGDGRPGPWAPVILVGHGG